MTLISHPDRRAPQAGLRRAGASGPSERPQRPLVTGFCVRLLHRWPSLRILAIVDDFTRESLALIPDTSLSGVRVARELDALIAHRGRPKACVSDNGARIAGGCTSGHGISGMAQLSVGSTLAVAAMFAGGILTATLLLKRA